jgi:MFS family permease
MAILEVSGNSATSIPESGDRTSAYRYFVVAFLAIVYTFNFMDRQIMSILQEPIRREMALSDTQLGLLTGLAFALFYTTCGIPVAWLSDRHRRVSIMAAACAIWSVFTVGCGFAQSFAQLAFSRVFVGMGEAGGSPPSYSLISDYFPKSERGVGLAIYSLGVPAGSALGAAIGGWVAAHYGWRAAFVAVGLPGIVLALAMLVVIREPKRGGLDDRPSISSERPALFKSVRAFFTDRTMALTALSSGLSAFVGYAMLSWNPSLLERVKGMSLAEVAVWYSLILGITGVVGTFAAGWLVDRLTKRDSRWYAWVPALAFAIGLPSLAGIILAPTWPIALGFIAVPALLNNMYLAPALAVVQNGTPPERRTMAGATLLFVLNLIGLGGGPVYVGWVSDLAKARFADQSLLVGYTALAPVVVLTIAVHLAAASSMKRPTGNKC